MSFQKEKQTKQTQEKKANTKKHSLPLQLLFDNFWSSATNPYQYSPRTTQKLNIFLWKQDEVNCVAWSPGVQKSVNNTLLNLGFIHCCLFHNTSHKAEPYGAHSCLNGQVKLCKSKIKTKTQIHQMLVWISQCLLVTTQKHLRPRQLALTLKIF